MPCIVPITLITIAVALLAAGITVLARRLERTTVAEHTQPIVHSEQRTVQIATSLALVPVAST